MSTSEEEKIPSVEKNSTREGGGPGCIGINLEGKDQHEIDQEAKKIQDPMDTEDPASRVGSAVINKEEQLSGAEKTEVLVEPDMPGGAEDAHLLAVPEEEDASTQMKKKENKRKRSKLQEIKKEEQLSGAEKTEVLVEPDMPVGAEDAHLLAVPEEEDANTQMKKKKNKRKRSKLGQRMLAYGVAGDYVYDVQLHSWTEYVLSQPAVLQF